MSARPDADEKPTFRRTALRMAAALVPLAALFVAFGLFAFRAQPRGVGEPVASYELPTLAGEGRISSGDLHGRPYVINFWASWCVPCREEAPVLAEVAGNGEGTPAFIGWNILDGREDALGFVDEFEIRYPNLWDTEQTFRRFKVSGVPETVFVDGEGRIVGRHIGAIDEATLRELMQDLVTLPPGELLRITSTGSVVEIG